MNDVNEHLVHIWAFAAECMAAEGALETGAVCIDGNNRNCYVPSPPPGLRELFPGAIRLVAALMDAELAIVFSEAWLVDVSVDDAAAVLAEGVESRKDRREVVLVAWTARDGRNGAAHAPILRDQGTPRLGDIVELGSDGAFNRLLDGVFAQQPTKQPTKH